MIIIVLIALDSVLIVIDSVIIVVHSVQISGVKVPIVVSSFLVLDSVLSGTAY